TVNGGSGGNTISVVSTGVPLTVNAGAGNDSISAGGGAGLNLVRGELNVNGQAGSDLLTINDQPNTGAHTYEITSNSVSRPELLGPASIVYNTVESLALNPGNLTFLTTKPSNTINVRSSAAGTPV